MKENYDNWTDFDDRKAEASRELKQLEFDLAYSDKLNDQQFQEKLIRYYLLNHFQN